MSANLERVQHNGNNGNAFVHRDFRLRGILISPIISPTLPTLDDDDEVCPTFRLPLSDPDNDSDDDTVSSESNMDDDAMSDKDNDINILVN